MTLSADSIIDLYSIDKLMHETRQLAARYRQTTGTSLPVTSEIARFDAAKALDLQLLENPQTAYDAHGLGSRLNQRIIIKGRAMFDTSSTPRIGQLNLNQDWDSVVLVLFDELYQPVEMYEASKTEIEAAISQRYSPQKKRGAMSVAQFKIIGQRVWTQQNGSEDEIWSNS